MLNVTLPWPAPELSPNGREHWTVKAEAVKAARTLAWRTAQEELWLHPVYISPDAPLVAHFEFYPPNKRWFDLDNLVSRAKNFQDGLFDALGINDRLITRTIADRCGVYPGGKVVIMIERRGE